MPLDLTCSCYDGMRGLSRAGWTVEVRPSAATTEPAATDVACRSCGQVYRLHPVRVQACPARPLELFA